MMTNDDKVKFQNILYIRNEYALKALLDSIVANGEFSEDDVISMFLRFNIFDGTVSEQLIERSYEILCKDWTKPEKMQKLAGDNDDFINSRSGKETAIKACNMAESLFGHPIEDFSDLEYKFLYVNKVLSVNTGNTYYFSAINDKRKSVGKREIRFTKNPEYSNLPLSAYLSTKYFKDTTQFADWIHQAQRYASKEFSYNIMVAALTMIYCGVDAKQVCSIKDDQVNRESHCITDEDGVVYHIPKPLWQNIERLLKEYIDARGEYLPSEYVLKIHHTTKAKRGADADRRATYDGILSCMGSVGSDIKYHIYQEDISKDSILYGKSTSFNNIYESGLFNRAYSEGIRTADDFKMYVMGSKTPTKRGLQKIGMRANLYMQWLEMYHK